METSLQVFVTVLLVIAFVALLVADVIDDCFLGNRWHGMPPEMYALVGSLVIAVFRVVRRNGNNKEDKDAD